MQPACVRHHPLRWVAVTPSPRSFVSSTHAQYSRHAHASHRELILSVLEAQPSARDSRVYLNSFAPPVSNPTAKHEVAHFPITENMPTTATHPAPTTSVTVVPSAVTIPNASTSSAHVIDTLLEPVHQHTGLVKIQGPFSDRQLESICDGLVYLQRLGLVPIVIVDSEDWPRGFILESHVVQPRLEHKRLASVAGSSEGWRSMILHETRRVADMLEQRGGRAVPLLQGLLRLGDGRGPPEREGGGLDLILDDVSGLRAAVNRREIPVVAPVAINASCASVCIPADEAVRALSHGLALAGAGHGGVDLTPVRLMIINREGGVPSPARQGEPHLSINILSELDFICKTFQWHRTHPTSLANLWLMKRCLDRLPKSSSGLIVSHKSPKSLIANLITNRPAHSPSLKRDQLQGKRKGRSDGNATPTLVRRGLEIRVLRNFSALNLDKLTTLLEQSFGRVLAAREFYTRLEHTLDFCIVAGDYQGIAIVTAERDPTNPSLTVAYLDKFAVLPSLQGDGTVDFLWGALRDESFGLGSIDALNNNGGLGGVGTARDLVWRSRSNNPVNKWYFERANGSLRIGTPAGLRTDFHMFWAAAEMHLKVKQHDNNDDGGECTVDTGELGVWVRTVSAVGSCWA